MHEGGRAGVPSCIAVVLSCLCNTGVVLRRLLYRVTPRSLAGSYTGSGGPVVCSSMMQHRQAEQQQGRQRLSSKAMLRPGARPQRATSNMPRFLIRYCSAIEWLGEDDRL